MTDDTAFSPAERRALDRFAPPPPAAGFAQRALDRVQRRDAAKLPPLPRLARRWRSAGPWRRAGVIVGGVASLSLVSAAAAATGVFGEPVHVPVISQIAQSLDIVPEQAAKQAPQVAEAPPQAPTRAAPARQQIDTLLDDPEFRALPRPQRRAELRRTARELVTSGEATPREVITALRDTGRERIAELTPEQRAALAEAAAERREAISRMTPRERRQALRERRAERRAEWLAPQPEAVASPENEGSGEVVR
jgi:hypothetical protein